MSLKQFRLLILIQLILPFFVCSHFEISKKGISSSSLPIEATQAFWQTMLNDSFWDPFSTSIGEKILILILMMSPFIRMVGLLCLLRPFIVGRVLFAIGIMLLLIFFAKIPWLPVAGSDAAFALNQFCLDGIILFASFYGMDSFKSEKRKTRARLKVPLTL